MSSASSAAASEPARLVLHDVAVRFGAAVGLASLSFSVAKGERMVLLGPSGAGKSSLLRAIAGLDAIARGAIWISDVNVTTLDPRGRGAVYMQQRPLLFPHLSVIENVAFPLTVRGVPAPEARAHALTLLAQVQLEGLAARRSTTLSGGQQHRVALARALAARPSLLLLDEPFAALDPTLRADVREMVCEVVARHELTTILVTHDVDEALRFASRIAILLDGAIQQDAAPDALMARPASAAIARFLGIPNILPVRRSANGAWRTALGAVTNYPYASDGSLIARASAIRVHQGHSANAAQATVIAREERVDGTRWRVRLTDSAESDVVGIGATEAPIRIGDTVYVDVAWESIHLVAGHV